MNTKATRVEILLDFLVEIAFFIQDILANLLIVN